MFAKATLLSAVCLFATTSEGKDTVSYQIEVQVLAAQPALVVKGKVRVEKAGDAIGGNIGAVATHLGAAKLKPAGAPFTRTYSFENGVLEFESGFPVAAGAKGKGDVIATELPNGMVATTIHVGDQATSEKAYEAIHAWMKANGKSPAGAPWEVYLTDPGETPASQARMQVFFPVQ